MGLLRSNRAVQPQQRSKHRPRALIVPEAGRGPMSVMGMLHNLRTGRGHSVLSRPSSWLGNEGQESPEYAQHYKNVAFILEFPIEPAQASSSSSSSGSRPEDSAILGRIPRASVSVRARVTLNLELWGIRLHRRHSMSAAELLSDRSISKADTGINGNAVRHTRKDSFPIPLFSAMVK